MYNYQSEVEKFFKEFVKKQEPYMMIVLKRNKEISPEYDSFTNFYNLKFLPSFKNKAFDLLPPDLNDNFVTSISNIFAFYDLQNDLPRIRKYLVQIDSMKRQLSSLRSLLRLAKWMRED